ncbi:MAG: NAD(P)-dependent oxidoreductase [Flavobacteriales bacterium]|nr:NAD(P)-dependent oxidoreductase [Flavobacteriales bacterium]MBL4735989.1 NAD(P)-dependent oxidoreductase [Flavobacteriales bacterium]
MSKKVLITGGAGFIGCNVAIDFKAKGYDLLLVDTEKPRLAEFENHWACVDLLEREALAELFVEFSPDIVIHLAAITDLNGKDLKYYEVNIKGTQNLIEACRQVKGIGKIIFTSSMLVCKTGYIPADYDDYCPDTVYGESKVEMEKLIKRDCHDMNWTIVRPTSIWGPWFQQPYRSFFDMVKNGRYFDLGRHACTKTYGYIGNVTHQIEQLMNMEGSNGRTFYLGDQPPIFISEWAGEITDELKTNKPIKLPFFMFKIAGWIGDMLQLVKISFPVTSFRIRNMTTNNILPLEDLYQLAGQPPFSRKEGIGLTLEWMNKNTE